MTTTTWAIVIASGKEEMLNADTCTAFLNLNNKPVLSYSLRVLEHCPDVDAIVVVAPKDRLEQVVTVIQLFGCHKVRKVVPGGTNEFASVLQALKYVDDDAGVILMHEASRPGLVNDDVTEVIKQAKRQGVALAGKAVLEETARVNKSGQVEDYQESGSIWLLGTPVAVKYDVFDKAQATLRKKKKTVKSLMEALQVTDQKIKVIGVKQFPAKIGTAAELRRVELSDLPF